MWKELRLLPGGAGKEKSPAADVPAEKRLKHLRNVSGSLLQDSLDIWGDIWDQMQGSLTHGVMVVPDMEKDFEPECGWPEFLEKLWLLRHYLDHAKRFCEGKD